MINMYDIPLISLGQVVVHRQSRRDSIVLGTVYSSYSSSGISWHCIELYRPAAQVGRSIDDCTARSGVGAQISCGEALSTYIKQMTNDRPKDR